MPYTDIYLYSPLSIKTVAEGHNRALLLQFILSELLHAMDADKKDDPLEFVFSSPACFFPYDWSYDVGCLNKVREHAELLEHAFPTLQGASSLFKSYLNQVLDRVRSRKTLSTEDLGQLYTLLEPFLMACNGSESLLLYLLQNREKIDKLIEPGNLTALLKKIHPNGLEGVTQLIHREYKNRGFNTLSLL